MAAFCAGYRAELKAPDENNLKRDGERQAWQGLYLPVKLTPNHLMRGDCCKVIAVMARFSGALSEIPQRSASTISDDGQNRP